MSPFSATAISSICCPRPPGIKRCWQATWGSAPHQLSYVTHSGSGEGLLFYGDTTIPFVDHFPQDTELYTLLTTKPEDKANGQG